MTTPKLLFIAFTFGLFSCGQNFNNTKQADTTKSQMDLVKPIYVENEKWTLYNLQDTIVHVKRLLSSGKGFVLISYDINTAEPEAAVQTFISTKFLTDEQKANELKSQSPNFNCKPYKERPTLFVQIDGSVFKDEFEAVAKRQKVEKDIETALKTTGLGEWTAGDVGPGGANMLFEVNNINNSLPVILNVLQKSGFDKKTTIGRRINSSADDWFYEVIYPTSFSGDFITM